MDWYLLSNSFASHYSVYVNTTNSQQPSAARKCYILNKISDNRLSPQAQCGAVSNYFSYRITHGRMNYLHIFKKGKKNFEHFISYTVLVSNWATQGVQGPWWALSTSDFLILMA